MLSLEELHLRAALFRTIRKFFYQQNFLEVDTPIRQPVIIPESNIEPILSGTHFLQTSPELCMKRLIAAGCTKIFQLCHCFRKEERGSRHLEEFFMLEWYRRGGDYFNLMNDCQQLFCYIAIELCSKFPDCSSTIKKMSGDNHKKFDMPWQRITVAEAFDRWSPLPLEQALAEDNFDEILVRYLEPNLGYDSPALLYDYPIALASLARKKKDDPRVAERFELYIEGIELANGFSELTDPQEQRLRFEDEIDEIEKKSGGRRQMPQTFLKELEHMEDTAGIALGVDRLFMLLLGKKNINRAVTFSPLDLE